MAGHTDRNTMENLEDGEISGSDSETEMHSVNRQMPSAGVLSAQHFQSRDRPHMAPHVTSYRSSVATDSSDSDSDEEAALWRRKRQKCTNVPPPVPPTAFGGTSTGAGLPGRKVNNIWGSVVQEQSQEAVAAELGIMGMEGGITMDSRQCETYNYILARKLMEKEKQEEEHGMETMLEEQLEEYRQHGAQNKSDGHLKRKRPVKERLGDRAEMDFKGRYEITADDPKDKVIEEIAHRLMEPKMELIERVVNVIGTKKAIELLSETATIEQNGGLYTVDGSRRRTPGGVYLNLLKNTPSITQDQIKTTGSEHLHNCSSCGAAVVSIYQKWSTEETVVNWRQGYGRSRLIAAHGESRLDRVIRSNRRATVDQTAENVNAGSVGKMSEYTVQDGSRLQQKGDNYNIRQEIFHDENQKEYNNKKANKKAAKQRQKYLTAKKMKQAIGTLNLQEHDDVSRETFASDTNDALESLEDGGEEQAESAQGTEEAPVVYNSNDLEVF